ncbi:MAG: hypothetical protein ACRERC_16550 [Candidatus Binatia bacterium]
MTSHPTRFALATLAVLLLAVAAGAADGVDNLKNTTPAQRAAVQDALMQDMFSPTADQQAALAALNLKYAEKMEPLIKGDDGFFARMRGMKAVNEEKEAEMQKLLTPAQWTQYLDGKADMRKKFDARIAAQQP